MNAVTKILGRILGSISARGTLRTPSGNETYPIAISNEIMGGPFIVDSIEEMKEIPVERLLKGCKCTVNEHEFNGVVLPTTTYMLRSVPKVPNIERLSDLPEVNISEYWILDRPQQKEESAVEYQYAPNYKGLKPPFLGAIISIEAYNAGYGSDADYLSGDTGLKIWDSEYDSAKHIWVRQRTGTLADWSLPMKIDEGYEEWTYNDIRFQWREKSFGKPTPPSSMVNGRLNNEPAGWEDTPETPEGITYQDYILTHDLWRISAIKGVYRDLKSNWSDPIKVSTNPALVRYGNDASNKEYTTNELYWRGYYSVGDRYKASRVDTNSEWIVELITGESGEYTDYVFKEFPDSHEPDLSDAPTTKLGYGINGWRDGVFVAQPGYTIYVSTSRKFSNGEVISWWTIPMRFDGKNTRRCIVTPIDDTGNLFKYKQVNGNEVIYPSTIVLQAKLFDGINLVTPSNVRWFLGTHDENIEIAIGAPNKPVISGVNNSMLTVSPSHVDTKQVITAVAYLEGEDYEDEITLYDVTDGVGYVPHMESDSGYTYKGTQTKTFEAFLYENGVDISSAVGVTYEWKLDTTVLGTAKTVQVSDTQVSGIANLTLTVKFLGQTYTLTEALTDVADGKSYERQYSALETLINMSYTPDTPNNPNQWGLSSLNAVWVIERKEGEAWNAPYRVKGEKGTPNGAFQKTVYRTYNPASPPATEWRFTVPNKKTNPQGNLIPVDWSETPQTDAPTGSTIYGVKATFMKNPATESVDEIVANWSIVGNWSKPFRVTYFASDGEGLQGEQGNNGWTPVLSLENRGNDRVVKIVNWTGGQGDKPAFPQYVGATGFTALQASAVNVRGATGLQGPKGDDGVTAGITKYISKYTTTSYQLQSFLNVQTIVVDLNGYIGKTVYISAYAQFSCTDVNAVGTISISYNSSNFYTSYKNYIGPIHAKCNYGGGSNFFSAASCMNTVKERYLFVSVSGNKSNLHHKGSSVEIKILN